MATTKTERRGARPSSRSISEAVETSNYSQLKKLVNKLEASLSSGAPMGDLVYQLVDISLRSGFLLGRAYEHAMLRGPERVQSGVDAVDNLFERVRRVESRVLSLLGTRPTQGALSAAGVGKQADKRKPSTRPSMVGSLAAGRHATGVERAEKTIVEHWQGLSKDKPLSSFDPRAIQRGAKVEKEHTGKARSRLARRIAADHLTEDPRYYQKLERAGLKSGQA
jgi:hypothetical protein